MERQIKETKNYEMFKKKDLNRPICRHNLQKIIRSVSLRNMLQIRPILVNEKMEVIDGQHRLEAAKALDLPIFYEVYEDSEPKDIFLLNDNQKPWVIGDYLNYYAASGNTDYINTKRFLEKLNIDMSTFFALFIGRPGGNVSADFKQGKYKFPSEEEMKGGENRLIAARSIIEHIQKMAIKKARFVKNTTFIRALLWTMRLDGFDLETFLKKLEICMDKVRPCRTIDEYANLLIDIYNYKNRNPLEIAK